MPARRAVSGLLVVPIKRRKERHGVALPVMARSTKSNDAAVDGCWGNGSLIARHAGNDLDPKNRIRDDESTSATTF